VGNSVLNVAFWAVALTGMDGWRLIVMGDDSVLAVRNEDAVEALRRVKAVDSGLVIEPVLKRSWHDVTFCSSRFFRTPLGGVCAALKPGRTLVKHGFALDFVSGKRMQVAWVQSAVRALVMGYAFVPGMRALALRLAQVVFGVADYPGLARLMHGDRVADHVRYQFDWAPVIPLIDGALYDATELFVDFAEIYGCTVDDVRSLEEYFLSLPDEFPWTLDHPVIDLMVDLDVR
jgi:hypothetical protein